MKPMAKLGIAAAASTVAVLIIVFAAIGPALTKPYVPPPASSMTIDKSASLAYIPASEINGTASYYSYNSTDGTAMRLFAVKDAKGKIHVALDACDVCYKAKKGYRQVEGAMMCNNCGTRFPIEAIGTATTGGGCWPSFVPMSVIDGTVNIQLKGLDDKSFMFK